ncbi:MAG: excinuclease ABC subunit UvrA [Acidobacteriota bacterium]
MHDDLAIDIRGARTHNLKGVDCRIPHGQVTVVTGVSGAGKSSLAFDTVYAEAQRRFVESMSTYARQFLEQMERPPVDAIDHVLPAVALEAHNSVRNARATVGTLTEVHDVLRLLFAHLGEVSCPNGHGAVVGHSAQGLADALIERFGGQPVTLLAALERPPKGADVKLKELIRQGYFRRWENGERVRMTPSQRWLKKLDPLVLVLGRFRTDAETRVRLLEAIDEAYLLTSGRLQILGPDGEILHFGRALTCETCGARMERPTPALFSFNSPLGACPTCQGFGRVTGIDRARVIPDTSLPLADRPIAPWNSPSKEHLYPKLLAACRGAGVRVHVPWRDLSDDERDFVWHGQGSFTSLDKFFARLERKSYKMHVRILLARYRAYEPCPDCLGRRLKPEALAVRLAGKHLAELSAMPVEKVRRWAEGEDLRAMRRGAGHLVDELTSRLETLERVGLGYLALDRQGRTLSGGESQRIQLASSLGSGLTGTLYVLDEPTIGLHPQDSDRLLALLRNLAQKGNTVLVVEHDRTLIEGADHVIDLGPRAGEHGGEVIAEGRLDAILEHGTSRTAAYLREPPSSRKRKELEARAAAVAELPTVEIRGATAHNLRGFDVAFPLGCLVAVTGVSGSGKSTLVENVLHGSYQRARGVVDVEPGEHDALVGLDDLADVVMVDQRPLGRSSRSNPVTYTKAYDDIRKLFAATPDATRRGIEAGHFSFNLDRGRCEACKGTGTQEVDMQFMAPVTVTCDSCQGRRFKSEVLAVRLRGRDIFETLDLTVTEAVDLFGDQKRLCRKLQSLVDVGLGYLRLGQSTSTLSGGEAQRLKLASFLDRPAKDGCRLFLFDEPTTGLHLADIDLLHRTFERLVERGHGVVVVEHSTDLVAKADWIVDLGPGGGAHGGELLYSGPLGPFLDGVDSATARELRRHLRWRRRRAKAS